MCKYAGIIIYYQNISLIDGVQSQTYNSREVKDLQKEDFVTWLDAFRSLLDPVFDYKKAKVSDAFVSQSGILIEKQIQIAGIRLAGVLERFFK